MLAMVLFALAIAASVVSSQTALRGSALVVLLASHGPRQVVRTLAVLWCRRLRYYHSGKLHCLAEWIALGRVAAGISRARIILWEYTVEQTLANPVLGVGVELTPALTQQQKAALAREQPPGFIFPRTTGHHARNIFLRTWYELGAIGVVLFAIAGAAVAASAQPFAAGAFAAFALVGAFAWGMWHSGFMSAVTLISQLPVRWRPSICLTWKHWRCWSLVSPTSRAGAWSRTSTERLEPGSNALINRSKILAAHWRSHYYLSSGTYNKGAAAVRPYAPRGRAQVR